MRTQEERFLAKVRERDDGCWEWLGWVVPNGYGDFYDSGNHHVRAHRWAFEHWVKPIPSGMLMDHVCHDPLVCKGGSGCPHRRCVNPAHLVVATAAENAARSVQNVVTACPYGHPYDETNTYRTHAGTRQCVECNRTRARERQRRIRARAKRGM